MRLGLASQLDVSQESCRPHLGHLLAISVLKDSTVPSQQWELSLMTTPVRLATTVRLEHPASVRKSVRLGTTAKQERTNKHPVLKDTTTPTLWAKL